MTEDENQQTQERINRHLRFGWWSLLCFLTLGIVLEGLHGFKVSWYLDVGNETRRLMGRLAHAHGTLLAIVNIAFALTVRAVGHSLSRSKFASQCLIGASLIMPLGFLLGGISIYGGDPGLAILMVPIGGLLLLLAVAQIAWRVSQEPLESAAGGIAPQAASNPAKRRRKR